jgi:hypothetical protein
MVAARAALEQDKGVAALEPWNTGFLMAYDADRGGSNRRRAASRRACCSRARVHACLGAAAT